CGDLTLTPVPVTNTTGMTTITLIVRDELGSAATNSFTFEVVPATNVSVPDPQLAGVLTTVLQAPGTNLTLYEMRTLQNLTAVGQGITNITGLQTAINLLSLDLSTNAITDASLIGGLTNLQSLLLDNNPIGTISWASSLKNVTIFSVPRTGIQDISPIASRTNMYALDLSGNLITNLNLLTNFSNVQFLTLNAAGLRSLSFLNGFTQLQYAELADNEITNLTPLLSLGNLFSVILTDNGMNLNPGSSNAAVVTALQSRGVTVVTQPQVVPPVILSNSPVAVPPSSRVLTFSSVPGRSYTVQASSNLLQWTNIGALSGPPGTNSVFTDSNAAIFNRRFYRILSGN